MWAGSGVGVVPGWASAPSSPPCLSPHLLTQLPCLPPPRSGRLGKVTLGGGNKSGLFQVLNTDYSPRVAAECMNRLAKLRCVGEGVTGAYARAELACRHRLHARRKRRKRFGVAARVQPPSLPPRPPRPAPRSARFIGDAGFSIGIDDVTPAHLLKVQKQRTVEQG